MDLKQVNSYFKALKSDNAYWRANWVVTPIEGISPYEDEILEGKSMEGNRQKGINKYKEPSSYAIPDLGDIAMSDLAIRGGIHKPCGHGRGRGICPMFIRVYLIL